MFRKAIIWQAVVLILQMFLPCMVRGRSYGCLGGYCAMKNCRSSSGSGFSDYCWIAADSAGSYLRCGGRGDCRGAAQSWGNCKAGSCQFDRAPDPYRNPEETCESMNAEKLDELKNECRSYSFEKWTRDYSTPRQIQTKFEPCVGGIVEGETKKVIKYCHCYNSCGKTQTDNGDCEVQGLDRRIDFEANTGTTYHAICKIDCDPVDKYVFLAALKHNKANKANLKVTITKGMTSSKTTSSGGSASVTVSGEVGANVLEVFSVKLGVSGTTGFDWSSSSSSGSFEQRSYEISVPVNPGDEVNVYQVIGECENSDGTKYTVETTKYETRDKNGQVLETSEVASDE